MFEEIYCRLKNLSLSLEAKSDCFAALINWIEKNIPEENRLKISEKLMSVLDAVEANDPAAIDDALDVFDKSIKNSQKLFVLVGTDKMWFLAGVISYLENHRMNYCLYGEETGVCGDRWYLNCSESEFSEDLLSKQTVDLYYFMNLCYFSFPEYQVVQKNANCIQPDAIEGIITGMSYFRDGINVNMMNSNAINLSCSSQDLYYDFVEFKKYCSVNTRWAVIGLAPYSLRYDESLSKNKNNIVPAYIVSNRNKGVHNSLGYSSVAPIQNLIDALLGKQFCSSVFWDAYIPLYGTTTYDMDGVFASQSVPIEEQIEISHQYNKPYEKTLEENKEILINYLKYCSSQKVEAIIVLPPFTDWYKANWDKSYIDELLSFLKTLEKQFPFTLCNFAAESWPDEYFRNGSHVNIKGQKEMTLKIDALVSAVISKINRLPRNDIPYIATIPLN